MTMADADRVRACRENPSRENLRELLLSCQDRVYNVCLQVLRQPQDAEDAAQEALLKIAAGIGSGTEIRRFDPWVVRVAFTTALNALKMRKRRSIHEERRAQMAIAATPPDEAYEAVHAALGSLDDDARCVIVRHFFEQRSLEELGRDEGMSPVAVWKRLEKAKTSLRESLLRSGLGAFAPSIDGILQSIRPAAAPAGIVSDGLLAKAALFLAPAAPGVAGAVGGIAMTAKGFSLGAVAAVSLLLFFTGVGGGYLIKAAPRHEAVPLAAQAGAQPLALEEVGALKARASSPTPAPGAPAAAPLAPKEALLVRLQTLAQLIRNQLAMVNRASKEPLMYQELGRKYAEAWKELRNQAYRDVPTLFAFLRAPENKDIFTSLLLLFADAQTDDGKYLVYPPGFIDALKDLISTGTKSQRQEMASYVTVGTFGQGGAGTTLYEYCFEQLAVEKDPGVLSTLINALHIVDPQAYNGLERIEGRLGFLGELWAGNTNWSVREQTLEVLAKARTPEGEAMFLEKMDETLRGNDAFLKQYCPQILGARLHTLKLGDEDKYLPLFTTALHSTSEPDVFMRYASMSLSLPVPKAELLLNEARTHAPDAASKAGLENALDRIRQGETRADVLQQSLFRPRND